MCRSRALEIERKATSLDRSSRPGRALGVLLSDGRGRADGLATRPDYRAAGAAGGAGADRRRAGRATWAAAGPAPLGFLPRDCGGRQRDAFFSDFLGPAADRVRAGRDPGCVYPFGGAGARALQLRG